MRGRQNPRAGAAKPQCRGRQAKACPACAPGARLGRRFVSTRALFSPLSEVEVECGVVQLELILPPAAPAYTPDVWLARA